MLAARAAEGAAPNDAADRAAAPAVGPRRNDGQSAGGSNGALVVAAIGFVGSVGDVLHFLPEFEVTPGAPLDPGSPVSTPFTISYKSWVPVRKVRVCATWTSSGTRAVRARFDPTPSATDLISARRGFWTTRSRASGSCAARSGRVGCLNRKGVSITFPRPFTKAAGGIADITLEVEYALPLAPVRTKRLRFVSAYQSDGYLRLVPAWIR